MSLRIKTNFCIDILNPTTNFNKYSKSLLNIKTLIELEKKEGFELPKEIIENYNKIIKKEYNFINNIPLNIIEHYFYKKINNLNSYINIEFKENEVNIKTNEIFILLENFYNEIFLLASLIANYYNLEIKINNKRDNDDYV